MRRKRDDFISIDKPFSDLGVPVKALRKATPQALHHFTQADLGFMARLMAATDSSPPMALRTSMKCFADGAALHLKAWATAEEPVPL